MIQHLLESIENGDKTAWNGLSDYIKDNPQHLAEIVGEVLKRLPQLMTGIIKDSLTFSVSSLKQSIQRGGYTVGEEVIGWDISIYWNHYLITIINIGRYGN